MNRCVSVSSGGSATCRGRGICGAVSCAVDRAPSPFGHEASEVRDQQREALSVGERAGPGCGCARPGHQLPCPRDRDSPDQEAATALPLVGSWGEGRGWGPVGSWVGKMGWGRTRLNPEGPHDPHNPGQCDHRRPHNVLEATARPCPVVSAPRSLCGQGVPSPPPGPRCLCSSFPIPGDWPCRPLAVSP